jgi:SAM-dependent methyltransferase
MMFGLRQRFEYFLCSRCGCLQIATIPADLNPYYPPGYYSFSDSAVTRPRSWIAHALRGARDRFALAGRGIIGRCLYARFPYQELKSLGRIPGLSEASRILDVGCGAGVLLHALSNLGLTNLLGIDPYLQDGWESCEPVRIQRRTLDEVEGTWDVVMFHHSFEHMADPVETLTRAAEILSPSGCCLVRMPVVPSQAWREYGVDWVGLDAPRHLFIHSVESVRLMATAVGLEVREVVFDSTDFQFWGSEQYRRDIPLRSERSHAENPSRSIFSRAQILAFRRRATAANRAGLGDQAAFYLTRPGAGRS